MDEDRRRVLVAAGERLRALGYDEQLVASSLTGSLPGVPPLVGTDGLAVELEAVLRLFVAGAAVDRTAAVAVCGDVAGLRSWVDAGLLVEDGREVTAPTRVLPNDGLFVRSDHELRGRVRADHVPGVAGATRTLRRFLPPSRGRRRVLEVGTGCGYLAMRSAADGDDVVATDVSARAIALAEDSAALSGVVDRLDLRVGDRFAPVAGERFDLVLANPPFVVGPGDGYTYRDGDVRGDEFCRGLLAGAADVLAPGGTVVMLVSWPHAEPDPDGHGGVSAWFEGLPLDAWVLRSETMSAGAYASSWLGQTERLDPEEFGPRLEAWLQWYVEAGIQRLSIGAVVARRTERSGRLLVQEPADQVRDGAGAHAVAILDGLDLAAATEDVLLSRQLRCSPDLRVDQELAPTPQGWRVAGARMRHVQGLDWQGALDETGLRLLTLLDGDRTVGEALAELAKHEGLAPDATVERWLPAVRELIERGYVRR